MATRYLLQIDSIPKIDSFQFVATLPEIVAGLEANAYYPAPFGPMFRTLAERLRSGATSGNYFTNLKGRVVRWTWSIEPTTRGSTARSVEKDDDSDEYAYDGDEIES